MPPAAEIYHTRACIAIPTLVMLLTGATLAVAQSEPIDDSNPWAGVEEMVVTGSGMLDALTSATISVTAFDSNDLEAIGATDVSDVAAYTPNLEIRTAGATTVTLFIRGVGLNDFTANAAGSVAVYEDDAPKNLPAIQLGQLFDLEGVTILKGPQGSGPGRNASAGAIKIHTKKPTGDFEGFLRFDYGNYNLMEAEGAVDIPMIPDILATRLAFRVQQRDGTVTNNCGGLTQTEIDAANGLPCRSGDEGLVRAGLDTDLNNLDVWAARMATRLEPIEELSFVLKMHGSRRDQLGTVGQHLPAANRLGSVGQLFSYIPEELGIEFDEILAGLNPPTNSQCRTMFPGDSAAQRDCRNAPGIVAGGILADRLASRPLDRDPFTGDYNRPGFERHTTWGGLLTGDWEFDDFSIKSITGFDRYDRERSIDADYSPNIIFEFEIDDDAWQATQDLRISGDLEAIPLSWSAGAFYLQETLDYAQNTIAADGPIEPSLLSYVQDTYSLGVYGQFEWDFLDDFTLEAGARYNWERKTFDVDVSFNPGEPNESDSCKVSLAGAIPPCSRTQTVDHPTGTIGIKHSIDELRTVYMKYSHGWKGLQYNVRPGNTAGSVTDVADPEVIDAFEFGFSGSWWDDRLSVNGSFFWYLYKNYQVFLFTTNAGEIPARVVKNADDAQLYGAEVEAKLEPIDRLVAEVRFGWLESRFLDFSESSFRRTELNTNSTIVSDFNGNSLPNAPRFKVSGNLKYDFDLGRLGTITPRYDFSWSDDVAFDASEGRGALNADAVVFLPEHTIGQKALLLHNFRLTYAVASGNLQVSGWVRNLTNEVYKSLAFDASSGPNLVGNLLGDPRTYGLSAKVSF